MDISSLVQEEVVTVYVDDTLLDVAEVLRQEGVGSAVVLDPHDEVLGIVTDRDLVVYGQEFAGSLEQTTVNQVLSMSVFSVNAETSLLDLTEQMRESGVRRVPIVEDDELRGIVTLDDIVVHLAEQLDSPELRNLGAVIESESPSLSSE
jgi:CBS domain-containing protein